MNEPHVVALIYRVEQEESPSVDYSQAEPLVGVEEPEFHLEVRDLKARFEFKVHYETETSARQAIEEYIRIWEFDANLKRGSRVFRLKFDRAEIVDRNPTPGQIRMSGGISRSEVRGSSPMLTIAATRYPPPPSDLCLDPDILAMYEHYLASRRKAENVTSMAYFCLTVLEGPTKPFHRTPNKRQQASAKYNVDIDVLNEIGRLSTERGGPLEARKREGIQQELTTDERHFLMQAIKKVIHRAAEKARDPSGKFPAILLSDLPSI